MMKVKILPAAVLAGALLFYVSSCVKRNAEALGGGNCDTTDVRYSTQIVSILQNNCYACHNGPGASSGIDLSSYGAFRGWAGTSYVIDDITGAPGYTRMPFEQPPLSDCEINTIIAWIHQGMPNN